LYRLFCQYSGPICRYLAGLTGDPHRAEDLTQETFVRAYLALERGAQWDNPRAWLYRVASRLAINEHRRQKLIQWSPLWSTDVDPAPGLEATVAERLAVRKALDALSPKYKIPLVLYASEGYSVAEVAEMLELSTGAVKVRLYRARIKFRRAYEAYEGQRGRTFRDREAAFSGRGDVRANLPEEDR
jgi:RNA polymerase sigma-70 factor (ECF subfamily)